MIKIIVAVSNNGVIGKDNKLIWRQSDDLKRFKSLTLNQNIVMGRKTYESIGKPLPKRKNYILTRSNRHIDGCTVLNNIKDVLNIKGDIFIIGGGEVYKQFIDMADEIYITKVHCDVEGDSFFPKLEKNKWKKTFEEFHTKNSSNQYDWTYQLFKRN